MDCICFSPFLQWVWSVAHFSHFPKVQFRWKITIKKIQINVCIKGEEESIVQHTCINCIAKCVENCNSISAKCLFFFLHFDLTFLNCMQHAGFKPVVCFFFYRTRRGNAAAWGSKVFYTAPVRTQLPASAWDRSSGSEAGKSAAWRAWQRENIGLWHGYYV